MVSRSDLVRLLEASCLEADLRRGVTVTSLVQAPDAVEATFNGGSTERFDAVVACDGIRSATRDLIFGPATGYDWGWLFWTWWADHGRFDPSVAREWWGTGCVFGIYRGRRRFQRHAQKRPPTRGSMVMDRGFLMNVCPAGSHSIARCVKTRNAASAEAGTLTDLRTSATCAPVPGCSVTLTLPEW
jgi:2-polyprenyl-6-methoxyphenol hydroxylase-like FAD-dependent oxidoreductase